MNRQEILAIVLGGIVALGMAGGVVTSAAAASASDAPAEVDDGLVAAQDEENETTEANETTPETEQNQTTEGGQQNQTVPITEALEAAANDTNGTVVGAELGSSGGGILGGDGDRVYTVDSLLDNGTHIETEVNATNGSVTQSQQADDGFLQGIFGEDNVPEDPINLSAIYNATEAVELAQNETEQNGTVSQVALTTNDEGNLTYEVQMNVPDGEQTTVVIDAMRDGEGVIDVQGGTTTAAETTTETTTETETE